MTDEEKFAKIRMILLEILAVAGRAESESPSASPPSVDERFDTIIRLANKAAKHAS